MPVGYRVAATGYEDKRIEVEKMREQEFFFSVVLSVYNVEPYIREAMDA